MYHKHIIPAQPAIKLNRFTVIRMSRARRMYNVAVQNRKKKKKTRNLIASRVPNVASFLVATSFAAFHFSGRSLASPFPCLVLRRFLIAVRCKFAVQLRGE